MRYGSVCSGIESATCAWHPLGWKAAWFSEIEEFPSAILKKHYPEVSNLGDMVLLPNKILKGEIEAPEILVGGTPCQSFSMAGLRKGLQDPRGQLTRAYVEILDAIDKVRTDRGEIPALAIWENVPGVLSDEDNAFGNFLAALVGEDVPLLTTGGRWTDAGAVLGPKRRAAWRVLDAKYFGLAQRRRRVFLIVGSPASRVDPLEVLLNEPGLRDSSTKGKRVRERVSFENESLSTEGGGRHASQKTPEWNRDWEEEPFSFDVYNFGASKISHTLRSGRGNLSCDSIPITLDRRGVRKLTPTEYERLQGFPDDYTSIDWSGKPGSPEGLRYSAIGNSMAVPVMRFLGVRIEEVRKGICPKLEDVPNPCDIFDMFGG